MGKYAIYQKPMVSFARFITISEKYTPTPTPPLPLPHPPPEPQHPINKYDDNINSNNIAVQGGNAKYIMS